MFALGVEYLMGWAMAAADGREKRRVEWPPHPDRIFMAMAAAWFEMGEDPMQGEALRWLEALAPPSIAASDAATRGSGRRSIPVVSYVPVNDASLGTKIPDTSQPLSKFKKAGLDVLPEYRSRQPRGFPVAIPESPQAYLIWDDGDAGPHLDVLRILACNATHVGHPASMVRMWAESNPPTACWYPTTQTAPRRMRVSYPGRLENLRQWMNRDACIAWRDLSAHIQETKRNKKQTSDKAEKRAATEKLKRLEEEKALIGESEPVTMRPADGKWTGYTNRKPVLEPETSVSIFDDQLLVIALHGRKYPLSSTLRLTEALRGALIKACPEPVPEWLSGHAPGNSRPTKSPHLAFVPLPFTGHEHADGHIMGLALALPRGLEPEATAQCLNPAFWNEETGETKQLKLFNGQWLETSAEIELRGTPPHNLRGNTWVRPARVWSSVTPAALDRHFKGADKWDQAAASLKTACERIGLPRPETVLLNRVSSVEGALSAREFPRLKRKRDGGDTRHTHATLIFSHPVAGPVLLGAGRFRGYGLFRPMTGDAGHA
jgi:CRISPR-associated protein Csb2